jgi:hypothetical protein
MDADFSARMDASADRVPASERQAALALHSMLPADRSWMLARVPAASRERLQGLIDELRGLGVPAQAEWMRERCLDRSAQAARAPAAQWSDTEARRLIGSLSAEQAHRLLAAEPDRLIADVLELGPFRWQAPLLGLMAARRDRIEAMLGPPMVAGAMGRRDALLNGLAERARRLTVEAGPPSAPVHATGWSRWARRLLPRRGRP